MSDPNVHIAAWEAAGLIDAPLAERLRQVSTEIPTEPAQAVVSPGATVPGAPESRAGSALSFFGPSVAVVEMFAYLGITFLLAAWLVFLATVAQPGARHREAIITGGLGLAALILFGLGVLLARGDPRRRRAAGVAFAATTILAAGTAAYFVQLDFIINVLQWAAPEVLIGLVAAVVATFLRGLLPSVTTQFSLVASITTFAAALLAWADQLVHPLDHGGAAVLNPPPPAPDPIALVLVAAAWWLLVALGLGILGRFEARRAEADQGADRRAALTRFWAGLVAVGGVAQALTQSGNTGGFNYGRLLEPWIADVAILIVAAVLVERAFRRESNAFILSAAIGLIIALTDFNFSYLAQTTYVGLLIEGAILLAVGFAGDRFRRRINGAGPDATGSAQQHRFSPRLTLGAAQPYNPSSRPVQSGRCPMSHIKRSPSGRPTPEDPCTQSSRPAVSNTASRSAPSSRSSCSTPAPATRSPLIGSCSWPTATRLRSDDRSWTAPR